MCRACFSGCAWRRQSADKTSLKDVTGDTALEFCCELTSISCREFEEKVREKAVVSSVTSESDLVVEDAVGLENKSRHGKAQPIVCTSASAWSGIWRQPSQCAYTSGIVFENIEPI